MNIRTDVKFQNLEDVTDWVFKIRKQISDFKPLLENIADKVVYPILESKFDNEGATRKSSKWQELNALTIELRRFHARVDDSSSTKHYVQDTPEGAEGRILHWTGDLRRSVIGRNDVNSIFNISKVGSTTTMTLGTRVQYARVLDEGGYSEQGYPVPPRPIYVLDDFKEDVHKFVDSQFDKFIFTKV